MSKIIFSSLIAQKKLDELIRACIFYGSDDDGKITKTKLAKLVYLADFVYYYYNLKPITGVTYRKLDNGPVSNDYFCRLKILKEKNKIKDYKRGRAEMYYLVDNSKEIKLEKKEISLIKEICIKWKDRKTEEIVKFTHNQLPWMISFNKDEVPYSLIIQQDESTLY